MDVGLHNLVDFQLRPTFLGRSEDDLQDLLYCSQFSLQTLTKNHKQLKGQEIQELGHSKYDLVSGFQNVFPDKQSF